MGASQGKKKQDSSSKAPADDIDVTIDPQSSAALVALQQKKGTNKLMPWNETEGDDDMNDREGENRNIPPPRNNNNQSSNNHSNAASISPATMNVNLNQSAASRSNGATLNR